MLHNIIDNIHQISVNVTTTEHRYIAAPGTDSHAIMFLVSFWRVSGAGMCSKGKESKVKESTYSHVCVIKISEKTKSTPNTIIPGRNNKNNGKYTTPHIYC